jgi:RimJ/RimL family protein N-acetyltransferase
MTLESTANHGDLRLRDVIVSDLPLFFTHQQDPVAVHMAAFTAKDPADRDAFMAHWSRLLSSNNVLLRTITLDGEVIGHIGSWSQNGERELTYWLARAYWGRGLATRALAAFLGEETTRPLYARAAQDNTGSIRVLEKCGFLVTGADRGYANARGEEIDELIFELR